MRSVLLLLFLIAVAELANSQPKVQRTGLLIPATAKVDGKATEWGNKFQAYNKATSIFYTIANDEDNIYFIARATDENVIKKIIQGGITITLNSPDKKSENRLAITFPKYNKKNPPFYILLNKATKTADTLQDKIRADSLMSVYNKQLNDKLRIIGIIGVNGITDSVISIYNTEGVKAVAQFDNKLYYTCELSVPTKYLAINRLDKPLKFHYNIKLNGPMGNGSNVRVIPGRGTLTYTGSDGVNYTLGPGTQQNMDFAYPTDFSGEYVLATK